MIYLQHSKPLFWPLFLLSTLAGMSTSSAQTVPQLPGFLDPARVQQQFEERPVPRAQSEPIVPEFEDRPSREISDDIKFTLQEVKFQGNSIYPEEEFLYAYQKHIGQEISLTTIYDVADAITDQYRGAGYVLTRVFPPPQRIRDGIVELKIVEGFIDKIEIEGDEVQHGGLIWRHLGPVWDARPFQVGLLETAMLHINDLPGVSASSVMIPSFETSGASDLIIQIRKKSKTGSLAVNNRGTKFVGPYQFQAGASYHGLLNEFDRLSVNTAVTSQVNELKYIQTAYTMPLNSSGTKLDASISYNRSKPGDELSFLELQTKGLSASASVTHNWIRTREFNVSAKGGLAFSDGETFVRSVQTGDSRTLSANATLSVDFADQYGGANLARLTATQTINAFRSTAAQSIAFRLDLDRIQVINNELTLKASGAIHYSLSDISSALQFGYGGQQFGRAYDNSEITGDQGMAGKLELTYTPKIEIPPLLGFQTFTYYDIGAVWLGKGFSGDTKRSGASAGGGVRVFLPQQVSGQVEIAVPLTRPVASEDNSNDARLFFNLSKTF